MSRTSCIAASLISLAMITVGCSRLPAKPMRQIQVPDAGAPVLTSAEQSAQPQPARQEPQLISRMSYVRPLNEGPALKSFSEWSEQDAATDALGRIGGAAVPPLVSALHNPDPAVRLKAVEVLGRMGEDAQGAVPELVQLLNDPDAEVRKSAARTLGRIGPGAGAAVPALMQKLFEGPPPTP